MTYRMAIFVASLAALSAGAAAHHGWGSYDAAAKFTITGQVQHLEWQNPHVHMHVPHENANWEIVLAPVSRMQIRGLSPELIKAGSRVAAEGYPSRRNPREMRAERITVEGKIYELR